MFAKKTVDSILASFTRNVSDLHALAKAKSAEAEGLHEAASRLDEAAKAANGECARALSVAEKLSRLIGA